MIISTSDHKRFICSANLAHALTGVFTGGYTVQLHACPQWIFVVDAPTVDQAHAIVVAAVTRDRRLVHTGATITAREEATTICENCNELREDVQLRDDGCRECLPCWRAALEHGHRQGLHMDADGADERVDNCPICEQIPIQTPIFCLDWLDATDHSHTFYTADAVWDGARWNGFPAVQLPKWQAYLLTLLIGEDGGIHPRADVDEDRTEESAMVWMDGLTWYQKGRTA